VFPTTESLDTFERAAENPLSDAAKWSKLGWTRTPGRVYGGYGWVPKEGAAGAPESEADGAFWNGREFSEPAVSVHMYAENLGDYMALWSDTTGTGSKNGYRLKVVGVPAKGDDAFRLVLEKWVNGVRTTLAESGEVLFQPFSFENTVGLTDVGGRVKGWYGSTESALAVQVEAVDSSFSNGYVGIEGTNDNAFGEKRFQAG
jgi:hypothetical protein